MPVTDPNLPAPLREAYEDMEALVQSCKTSLAFCAPEMQDQFWIELQHGLAETIYNLYEEASK